mmetsp:Transcript_6888/g.10175  ORF Transcript_6888/g.10175 Transcript_6888/m.10175 type:complete len:886 (+) Transcript_6888:87-2744(+)
MAEETDFIGLISSFLGPASDDVDRVSPAPALSSVAPSISKNNDDFDVLPSTRVVIFSKDRPWQLQQLLRSMKLPIIDNASSDNHEASFVQRVDIFIICRATTADFAEGYEQIKQAYCQVDTQIKPCFLYEGEWMGRNALDHVSISDIIENKSFSFLLEYALNTKCDADADAASPTPSFVMFLTDDCVLLDFLEVVLSHAIGSLQYDQNDRVFNFLTRLHPGISRCQTRDCMSPSPRDWQYHSLIPYLNNAFNTDAHESVKHHDGIYLYTTKSGSTEWNYPFDLSGGVYRYKDVQMILKQIRTEDKDCNGKHGFSDQGGLSHPNTFEVRGNQAVLAIDNDLVAARKTLSAVPSRPLMVVLAINRVQDVCHAPIAGSGEGRVAQSTLTANDNNSTDPTDPSALLKLLLNGRNLDLERYLSTPYNSSHIGDVFLCDQLNVSQSSELQELSPDVSVLIPVHRGVDFVSHSIASIIMQCVDELHQPLDDETRGPQSSLSSMQIVIVDDRCDDGSIDVMIQSCKKLLDSQPNILLMVFDHREGQITLHEEHQQQQKRHHPQPTISIAIDIIASKSPGVASALNTGLDHCRSELVARMDADDICAPGRLISQLRFMRGNSSVNVVGASAVIFSTKDDQDTNDCTILPYHSVAPNSNQCHIVRTSLPVIDPGFLSWTMLFTCTISHPTVMFRKSAIDEIRGYDESIKCAEDYDLWLRMLEKDSRSILCLPFVGVWHRKHKHNNSVTNSLAQKKEANEARYRAICKKILSSPDDETDESLDIEHITALKDPATATSLDSINNAARLLMNMESTFLQKNDMCLTEHEIKLIQNDCNARIGELATIAISKFGKDYTDHFKFNSSEGPCYVWRLWSDRCPNEQFQRLSLLCHLTTTS